ncbi:hypothetical protein D3C84_1019410 [compost metagenome]
MLQHAHFAQQRQAQQAQIIATTMGVIDRCKHDVFQGRLVREQVEALEDHPDLHDALHMHLVTQGALRFIAAPQKGLALQSDFAMVEAFQAVHGADQRGLA